MTKLAAETVCSQPVTCSVDDLELHREGPSYTIDTVRQLRGRRWPSVTWLIGADMLNYLPRWHEAEQLLREADFLILQRPGSPIDWKALPEPFQRLRENVVIAPLVDLSATTIRERVRAGLPIDGMTPPAVVGYIRTNGLYL